MTKKKNLRNYYRITFQWSILILLAYMVIRAWTDRNYTPDYEAYCPFGGMQSLASFFSSHSLACSMTTVQIGLGIALLTGVILFSKLFCSYLCPIGTVTEGLGSIARKFRMQLTLKGRADQYLRVLKYILLFITFYFTVTASELFCRKFDPFYASFTGFSGDVILAYAIPALLLTIVGSFFIRQFWCRYLCPLGAVTNLAVYALPASAITLLWVLLTFVAGANIPWPWLLGTLCLAGFLFEATTLKFFIFPSLRITRNDSLCTHCRICDKKCPMAIPVSVAEKVDHIDCHLCTDCVAVCPEKGALTINHRNMRWLPALATLVLTAAAITTATFYELPTISETWGNTDGKTVKILQMDGLTSIKCFGSSRSFANHMKEIRGITGAETFVKHHRVRVYYDSSLISEEQVKAAIFAPLSVYLNNSRLSGKTVSYLKIGIDRCFDPNDQSSLAGLLKQNNGILALSTRFGEPVEATIYYDPAKTDENGIKSAVTAKLLVTGEGTQKTSLPMDFAVNEKNRTAGAIPAHEFYARFVPVTDVSFNKYDSFPTDQLMIYEIPFAQATDPEMQQWIPYLVSHLSNNDGIVRVQTVFPEEGPTLRIWFAGKLTDASSISSLLIREEFTVHYPDKTIKKIKNPFQFPLE
jgi:polyferredoxin